MEKCINKKNVVFIPGLGEQAKDYKFLAKYMAVHPIDWNKIKLPKGKIDTLIGFSMGAVLACEYARKNHVKNLILCSLTTGIETLKDLKTEYITFMVGQKEKWCFEELQRVSKTIPDSIKWKIVIIPKSDHKITGSYKKYLLYLLLL